VQCLWVEEVLRFSGTFQSEFTEPFGVIRDAFKGPKYYSVVNFRRTLYAQSQSPQPFHVISRITLRNYYLGHSHWLTSSIQTWPVKISVRVAQQP
jgi:hypothetical protein